MVLPCFLPFYNIFLSPLIDAGKNQNHDQLDGSLPANPVNDRRVANAVSPVTLKSTCCLP